MEQLEALIARVEALESEIRDPEQLKKRLLPLFDTLLLSGLQEKDAKTREILARYLADIFSESARIDREALQEAIAPILSPAISKEIEENKNRMIDALYPIMGGMVSRYVTHTLKTFMENINRKIEQGLSFERYRIKIQSKLTGVSESELLLRMCDNTQIEALFVIHKKTGLLIAEALRENSTIVDPEIVASMASAVKDFINDWINTQNEETKKEVELLSYGDATLYIESAGTVYMIAFLESEPSYKQRDDLHRFFVFLLERYDRFFQRYDGKKTEEISRIETQLHEYLENVSQGCTTREKTSTPYTKYLIAFVVLATVGYFGTLVYKRYSLKTIEEALYTEFGESLRLSYNENDDIVAEGVFKHYDNVAKVETILKKKLGKPVTMHIALAPEAIEERIAKSSKPKSYRDDIVLRQTLRRLESKYNSVDVLKNEVETLKKMSISVRDNKSAISQTLRRLVNEYDENTKRVHHLKDNIETLQMEADKLEKRLRLVVKLVILGKELDALLSQSPFYDANRKILVFDGYRVFAVGKVAPQADLREKIATALRYYLAPFVFDGILFPYIEKIRIVSYTDDKGSHESNLKISQARANNIAEIVLNLEGVDSEKIKPLLEVKGMAEANLIYKEGKVDSNASRRVEVSVVLDEEKLKNALER